MPMTSYLRKKLGDHAIGKTAFTMPTSVLMALFTASPTEAGLLTAEVVGGSYVRVEITSKMGAFDATTGIAASTSEILFATPTGTWGTLSHVGVMSALSPDLMLYYEPLVVPRDIVSGSRPIKFAVGQFRIRHI